jgi:hypothetical protein
MADPEIRFAFMAIQKGFITPQQAIDAFGIQVKENFSEGKHRRIGQILLDQGLIDRSQRDEVLLALDKMRKE